MVFAWRSQKGKGGSLKPGSVFSCWMMFSLFVSPPEKKSNYLKALSNIVNKLPKQVQVTELPAVSNAQQLPFNGAFNERLGLISCVPVPAQLLALLLEALSCPDQSIQLSTLSCLEPVLVNPPQALIQQLEALVNRLLALICSPAMVSEPTAHTLSHSAACSAMVSAQA